ncbi:DMT family transporter [Paenibacillus sp. MSJ-6]|uniref:DMT family transporter n=1 Tax=Paenibacillus brevis TaxID=2841508 RepID=A0ABS6FTN8_9BACL|nr:DMT family transporter [Paenibacillus brevis]
MQLDIIYALEPIFVAVIAYIFIGERLTAQGYIGAILVIAGIVLSQWLEYRNSKAAAQTSFSIPTSGIHEQH